MKTERVKERKRGEREREGGASRVVERVKLVTDGLAGDRGVETEEEGRVDASCKDRRLE